MIDSHSHSKLSHDGNFSIEEMMAEAQRLGLSYYAITEHLDRDYKQGIKLRFCRQLDIPKYEKERTDFLNSYKGDMYAAFGIEAGYSKRAVKDTEKSLRGQKLDFVINSIHTIQGEDPCYRMYFLKNSQKKKAYDKYLKVLYESLFVPYDYQIIGHIGYVTRYAPFEDISLTTPEFHDQIDEILKVIIEKDKTIEINTRMRKKQFQYLPEDYILNRYRELGGTKVTYSSDAHRLPEIAGKYELGVEAAKNAGFEYWTVYKDRVPHKVEF